jgi:hypothetical protein
MEVLRNTLSNQYKKNKPSLCMVKIVFSPDAKSAMEELSSQSEKSKKERMLLKAIVKKIEILKQNPYYGNPIRKTLIPVEYQIKYEIHNLFRLELPLFWRMLYTLKKHDSEIEIIAFIIDIQDHKEYSKKFGYKRK